MALDHPKIARAKYLLAEFNAACARFAATQPYAIVDVPGEGHSVLFDRPPDALAAIFGDFVHNLRCALDHAVTSLVTRDDAIRRKSAMPILDEPGKWGSCKGQLRGWGVPKEAIETIRSLQPFNILGDSRGHLLWLLSELDNHDKHRQLHVVIGYVSHFGGRTDSGFWFAPGRTIEQDQMLSSILVTKRTAREHIHIGLGLGDGMAQNLALWEPAAKPRKLIEILGGDDPLLTETLLACTIGTVGLLQSFG